MNSHAFLNKEISKRTKVSFESLHISTNQYDKPYVSGNPVFFNLSHSNNFWGIVFCEDIEIGIDVEQVNEQKNFRDIIQYYFTDKEQTKVLEAESPVYKFYEIWTRKEALLKALGVGINYPLNQLDVNNEVVEVKLNNNTNNIYLETIQQPQAFISIASYMPFKFKSLEINPDNFESFLAK